MIDFGLALCAKKKINKAAGTPYYFAPEVIEESYGTKADIWSLGVIIYTLIIGKPPFETNDVKTTYKKIRMNNYSFPDSVQISD